MKKCIVVLEVVVGVKSCTIVFLAWHFLFTSSDAFAVGCVVRKQRSDMLTGIKNRLQFETVYTLLLTAAIPLNGLQLHPVSYAL